MTLAMAQILRTIACELFDDIGGFRITFNWEITRRISCYFLVSWTASGVGTTFLHFELVGKIRSYHLDFIATKRDFGKFDVLDYIDVARGDVCWVRY